MRSVWGRVSLIEQGMAQCVVDHRLVAIPFAFRQCASRFYNGLVQHDGNAGLALGRSNRPALGIFEIVFIFHGSSLQVLATLVSRGGAR
ncbi:hypothetical protein D3C73_1284110 [compost metagenome]